MPLTQVRGFRVRYELDGPEGSPALMLSNSLGTTVDMWRPQLAAWSRDRRVIRYDTRGHGRTDTPKDPCTIEVLAEDALALLDHLDVERADFCGLSLGGLIGMWIAIHRPERIRRL